jgi:uncharacterized protein (TIGR02266 family)
MTDDRFPDSDANRRAYPRSPVVVREARCICGIDVFFGYAKNISRSGLFIATPKLRKPGDTYEIQFRLPGIDHEFKCSGLIKWVRHYKHGSPKPPGFGVEFTDLSDDDGALLDKWVDECKGIAPEED